MPSRKALVREVNPHLICVLCTGYFIEATTIVECLHSFCRSCLVKYLECSKFCPICDVQLHKNNPLLSVRCDTTLQHLVYKLIPGLYANEMTRRRKYYSELGGPSSGSDTEEYPIAESYYSPEDSISLSLEFVGNKDVEELDDSNQVLLEKQGNHRRYLQCPAAVTMSHLKKFLRMKYSLNQDNKVDVIYSDESLPDDFSLMDVAYTFSWNRNTPMRFKYKFLPKPIVPTVTAKEAVKTEDKSQKEMEIEVQIDQPGPSNITPARVAEEVKASAVVSLPKPVEKVEKVVPKPLEKKILGPEVNGVQKTKAKEEKVQNINGKRSLSSSKRSKTVVPEIVEKESAPEPEPKKIKLMEPEKAPHHFELQEKNFVEDIQEEDDDEDRLRISASEEDMITEEKSVDSVEVPVEPVVPVVKSEERRKGKKKSKKEKHHHHHRHHDRKRDSPPAATILHSPENDIMKLKVKLAPIKNNCNSKVTKYSIVEGIEEKKEPKEISPPVKEKVVKEIEKIVEEKVEKPKPKEEEPKKIENNKIEIPSKRIDGAAKEKLLQLRPMRQKNIVKQNGPLKPELMKMPPSSITVSKITAEEKRQMEQQKLLSNRNNGADAESKRPSLEIMLVNAPNKGDAEPKPVEPKKTIRPTPPSIPLVRLNRTLPRGFIFPGKIPSSPKNAVPPRLSPTLKQSPPSKPLTPVRIAKPIIQPQVPKEKPDAHDDSGALDLSEKSSRKSPDTKSSSPRPVTESAMRNLMTLTDTAVHVRNMNMIAAQDGGPPTLKIPQVPSLALSGKTPVYPMGARKPGPNQSVRQIPNPSALMYRQHALNGRPMPPPVVPLSSIRKMETMTRNIEKVAAGLTVKAAVEAGYGAQ